MCLQVVLTINKRDASSLALGYIKKPTFFKKASWLLTPKIRLIGFFSRLLGKIV